MSERKIIARPRSAGTACQRGGEPLGIGMPEDSPRWLPETVIDLITMTAEPGVIGGMCRPAGSTSAPPSSRRSSTSRASSTSTTAAGWTLLPGPRGGRPRGNLNVSRFGPRLACRRLHQHQPERQEGGLRGHLHRRQPEGRHRGQQAHHRERRLGLEVRRAGGTTAPSAAPGQPAQHAGALHHRSAACSGWGPTGCCSRKWRRASTSSATSSPDGFPPADPSRAGADGPPHLCRRADAPAPDLLEMPLDERLSYTTRRAGCSS